MADSSTLSTEASRYFCSAQAAEEVRTWVAGRKEVERSEVKVRGGMNRESEVEAAEEEREVRGLAAGDGEAMVWVVCGVWVVGCGMCGGCEEAERGAGAGRRAESQYKTKGRKRTRRHVPKPAPLLEDSATAPPHTRQKKRGWGNQRPRARTRGHGLNKDSGSQPATP